MKLFKIIMLLAVMLPLQNVAAQENRQSKEERRAAKEQAKREKEIARQQAYEAKHAPTADDIVYIFGVGTNFNDSTVYLTEVMPVPYLKLTKKYKFLPYRADFSEQLKDYLEATYEMQHEMTCVFYDTSRKTLDKQLYKIKKHYLDRGTSGITIVEATAFHFEKPDYEYQ